MKLHLKRLIIFLISLSVITIIVWSAFLTHDDSDKHIAAPRIFKKQLAHEQESDDHKSLESPQSSHSFMNKMFKAIDCLINDEYSISCLRSSDNAIYIPFSFIKKYFEINGSIVKRPKDGKDMFSWQQSNSKVYFPRESYDYKGNFLWFENYNVEMRDRVKCLSGIEGVPISIQWNPDGHFYPIQIAQFGLSHFSKNLLGKPRVIVIETGEAVNKRMVQYVVPPNASVQRVDGGHKPANKVLHIQTNEENVVLKLRRKPNSDMTLSFEVKPIGNFSLTAILKYEINSVIEFSVTYMTHDTLISVNDNQVIYGIGTDLEWKSLTRDLAVDIQKGLTLSGKKKLDIKAKSLHLMRLEFNGNALLDNLKLSSSAHETHARTAADWLVKNQDHRGGWPINVTRKLANGALILHPGWYSAMGQGHAISLLTRLYHSTGHDKYLASAMKAIDLFSVNASENGIRSYFLNQYVWYEEYPTTPSSFVLNGFMYALFGLYDLKMSCNEDACQKAAQLFDHGLVSLKKMLPLYDTGSGSLYDLPHFTLGSGLAPNLARWDYHATHINQLLFINSIDNDLIFQTTAKRWIGYMKGKRAAHN